jgi:uncharacterized RDD family membrane protein YckC
MKCPKCGYLGFESSNRCRHCGYDFSLAGTLDLPELPMRDARQEVRPLEDFGFLDTMSERSSLTATDGAAALDTAVELAPAPVPSQATGELPLFGPPIPDDEPLITRPSAPRAPLAVRRATPEVPRLRSSPTLKTPLLELTDPEPPRARPVRSAPAQDIHLDGEAESASIGSRVLAGAIDLLILAGVDAAVIYFTIQICGLTLADVRLLPLPPLLGFLLLQNGGYLVVLTAGGQTVGKMATGIKVVSVDSDGALGIGHSLLRTSLWAILALPAGLGFLTTLFSDDHRGLHDRFAGTKVVRASA